MRYANILGVGLALLSLVVKAVLAQAALPDCAVGNTPIKIESMGADGGQVTCFQTAFTSQSTCHPDDVQCVCTDEPLNAAMEACVLSACTVKEGLSTYSFPPCMSVG